MQSWICLNILLLVLAQFRREILPLRIETRGYHGEPIEERICLFGIDDIVEDAIHVLFHWSWRIMITEHIYLKTLDVIKC